MEEVSPFEPTVLGAMWRYRWMVLLIVAISLALSQLYVETVPRSYEAVSTLIVEDPRSSSLFDVGDAQSPQRYVADQAAILESTAVAERAVQMQSSLVDARRVSDNLDVVWDNGSNRIDLVFTSDTPRRAVDGVNAVAAAYGELRMEASSRDLEAALAQLDESIAGVDSQLQLLQDDIDAAIAADPTRQALQGQLDEAMGRLVELQAQLPQAQGPELDLIRAGLDDIAQQLSNLEALRALDRQSPRLASLLEEQSLTIERKTELLQRKDELSVEARSASDGIVLASPALTAAFAGVDPLRLGAASLVLGLLVAAGLAYLRALRDRTFEDRTQPELTLKAPLIADVPDFREERIRRRELPVHTAPASASAEAFRFISAALDFETEARIGPAGAGSHVANPDARLVRSFVIVSPSLGDGKTVVAANTSLASAHQGKRVLAVDADFGYQRLSSLLLGEKSDKPGLTDLVEKGLDFQEAVQQVSLVGGAHLDVVARGTVAVPAPDFFRSKGVRSFFEAARERYDVVVIDSPPMLHVAYASLLVRYADRVIAVIPHRGQVSQTEDLTDRLDYLETEVMGYVYNRAPLREDMSRGYGSMEDVLTRR